MELVESRHSVRQYLNKRIPHDIRTELNAFKDQCNDEGDLNIQIIYDEPECFSTGFAKYGNFSGVSNYISLVGRKSPDLDERCGYYGEKLVLKAQELGLNTCWTALTHGKSRAHVNKGEKEVILISLGYGKTQGNSRKSKMPEGVSNLKKDDPLWFRLGVLSALLAPTAVNQQKFTFIRNGNKVSAKAGKIGTCLKIDLGIVKYHFEIGAGKDNFIWA